MTGSFGRRRMLGAVAGIITGTGAGCLDRSVGGQDRSSTAVFTSTETEAPNRNCQSVPESDGHPKPWFDPGSPVDIEIDNGVGSDIEVALTVDENRRALSIPGRDQWLSGDIIGDGQRPTITVEWRKSEARVEWRGEQNNMGLAVFVVRENTIDASFNHKFCSKFVPPSR